MVPRLEFGPPPEISIELSVKEDWMGRAACKGIDPEFFHPEAGHPEQVDDAKAVCLGRCPVKAECLDYALEHKEKQGVWGAASERQRRRMRRDGYGTS